MCASLFQVFLMFFVSGCLFSLIFWCGGVVMRSSLAFGFFVCGLLDGCYVIARFFYSPFLFFLSAGCWVCGCLIGLVDLLFFVSFCFVYGLCYFEYFDFGFGLVSAGMVIGLYPKYSGGGC
jgi:hypothetical protein